MPSAPPSLLPRRRLQRSAAWLGGVLKACSFAALLALSPATTAAQALPALSTAGELGSALFAQASGTGMVLLIVRRDGATFFQGYGETAPGSGALPGDTSVVRLCSLTKIFTADLLARMLAAHTVRLDDTLAQWEPAWAAAELRASKGVLAEPPHPTGRRGRAAVRTATARTAERELVGQITLRELATHTSGLPREIGEAPRGSGHFTFPDQLQRWSWLSTAPMTGTPGERALYSNVAFDFLSDALAQAAAKPYAELLHTEVLAPLRMWQTTLYPSASECERLLRGGKDEGPCTVTEATEGSSGLYSTPRDMARWLRYLLSTGATGAQAVVLPAEQLRNAVGLDHAGEPTGMGLGWIHILPLSSADHIVQKTGGGAGFSTYIAIDHARGTALFLAITGKAPAADPPHAETPSQEHLNIFNGANKLLLAMSGLPPLPPKDLIPVVTAHTRVLVGKRAPKHAGGHHR